MKAILIEQNAFEEMHKNIQDVKFELAQMKKDLQSSLGDYPYSRTGHKQAKNHKSNT